MARLATGSDHDALDIVQDAMMALARRYARRSSEEWPLLFHRIVQNRIRDWHRRQAVRRAWTVVWPFARDEDGDRMMEFADADAPSTPCRVSQQRAIDSLEDAIAELPVRQQQVVMLRLLEGLDVNETARVMGCSAGSVKTHYSRALTRLKQRLGEHWP